MTRDDIIRLAREAGFDVEVQDIFNYKPQHSFIGSDENVERFANLIAAAERKRMDLNAIHTCHAECQNPFCVQVREAVAHEREACAQVCDRITWSNEGKFFANAIRNRTQGLKWEVEP